MLLTTLCLITFTALMNASKLGCLPGCQAQLLINNNKVEVSIHQAKTQQILHS